MSLETIAPLSDASEVNLPALIGGLRISTLLPGRGSYTTPEDMIQFCFENSPHRSLLPDSGHEAEITASYQFRRPADRRPLNVGRPRKLGLWATEQTKRLQTWSLWRTRFSAYAAA